MNAIYGLYPDPESAQRAVDSLRAAGLEERDIGVVSSQPFEEYDFGRRDTKTFMPWLAALGGLAGGLAGFLLASWSQKAYPLPTGGMPIVTLWTDGIITYEMTMLGAILATFLTLLATARLPHWKEQLYDPEVSNGRILIGVLNPPERLRMELENNLQEAGGEVKEFRQRA